MNKFIKKEIYKINKQMNSKSEVNNISKEKFDILNEKEIMKVKKKIKTSIIKDNYYNKKKEYKINFIDEINSDILMRIEQYDIKFKSIYNHKQNQSLETENEMKKICDLIYELNNKSLSFLSKKNNLEEKEISEIKEYNLKINFKINELNQKISSLINFYNEQFNFFNELITYFKNISQNLNLNFKQKFDKIIQESEIFLNFYKNNNIKNIQLKEKEKELMKKYSLRCETAELYIDIEKEIIKEFSKFQDLNKNKEKYSFLINDKINKCKNEILKIENELNELIEKRQEINIQMNKTLKNFCNYIQIFFEKIYNKFNLFNNEIKENNQTINLKEIENNIQKLKQIILEFIELEIYFEENISKCNEKISTINDNNDPRSEELNQLIIQFEKIKKIIIEFLMKYKKIYFDTIFIKNLFCHNIHEFNFKEKEIINNIEIPNLIFFKNQIKKISELRENIENNISRLKIKYLIFSILPNQFDKIKPILMSKYFENQNYFLQNKLQMILGNNFDVNNIYCVKKILK